MKTKTHLWIFLGPGLLFLGVVAVVWSFQLQPPAKTGPVAVGSAEYKARLAQATAQSGRDAMTPEPVSSRQHYSAPKMRSPEAERIVNKMKADGVLRIDPEMRKAWIDSLLWIAGDAQFKENMTVALAEYCSPGNPSITIYDKQSGRELASYGPFQGFKVY
jgi:hypothetical protein